MWAINGINHTITDLQKSQVLIDSCTQLGFDIPRFCYHENLKIAGNCRMCLIEDSKSPKPIICCAGTVATDLSIYTNTVQVKKARESVMEFLLINHPLDCPICDQGGECDLQDLALVYGSDHGRFYDYKRNIEDKDCGPVIKTVMNRCILCTRCVRFASDIAGLNSLGLTGRGGKMEIGSYVEKILDSELSGNLVDVCPVGALTSKPYSFVSRPWELKKLTIFNLFDEQPQLIRVDLKENEIVRISPAKNAKTYNLWITNKARYSHEGLSRNRLITPEILKLNCSWQLLLGTLKLILLKIFNNRKFKFDFNPFLSTSREALYFSNLEEIAALKSLLTKMGSTGVIMDDVLGKNSLIFLPRSNFFKNNFYKKYVILSINMPFELPLANILLSKQIEGSAAISLILWRSIYSPLLTNNIISLNSGLVDFQSLIVGKTWINFMYFKLSTLVITKTSLLNLLSFSNHKLKNIHLFLVNGNVTERGLIDLDISSLQQQNNFIKYTPPLLSYSASNQNNKFIDVKASIFLLTHFTHSNASSANEFLMPMKTYFEKSGLYYDTDYSILRLVKTLSTSNNIKSLLSLIKVWAYFFNVRSLENFTNDVDTTQPFTCKVNFTLEQFFSNLQMYRKIVSRRDMYNASALLNSSCTLAAIENSSLLTNIY